MKIFPTFPSYSTSPTLLQKECALLQHVHIRPEQIIGPKFADRVSYSPHQQVDKINKPHIIFNEEQGLKPKTEGIPTSLSPYLNLLCIQED